MDKQGAKQQAIGSGWTIVVAAILGLGAWGINTFRGDNRWDDEPAEMLQQEQLEVLKEIADENTKKLTGLEQTRLRTEQRNISKDLKRLDDKQGALTDFEKDFQVTLDNQLQAVQDQLDEIED